MNELYLVALIGFGAGILVSVIGRYLYKRRAIITPDDIPANYILYKFGHTPIVDQEKVAKVLNKKLK